MDLLGEGTTATAILLMGSIAMIGFFFDDLGLLMVTCFFALTGSGLMDAVIDRNSFFGARAFFTLGGAATFFFFATTLTGFFFAATGFFFAAGRVDFFAFTATFFFLAMAGLAFAVDFFFFLTVVFFFVVAILASFIDKLLIDKLLCGVHSLELTAY
jgi:hypothetical protein